jgi:hypothetical protein
VAVAVIGGAGPWEGPGLLRVEGWHRPQPKLHPEGHPLGAGEGTASTNPIRSPCSIWQVVGQR